MATLYIESPATDKAATVSKMVQVGVVIGSTRAVRIAPQVAAFVKDVIAQSLATKSSAGPQVSLTLVDIAAFKLPLTDEPSVPAHIKDTPAGYVAEHTRVWSATVAALDAFVFVTPQYNWGMPAALKNALDHLYREWNGKPAMVVSYGGRGGNLSAAALITVLSGMEMRVVKKPVCMAFPSPEFRNNAFAGQALGLDAESETAPWAGFRPDIRARWAEVYAALTNPDAEKSQRTDGLAELWVETITPGGSAAAQRG